LIDIIAVKNRMLEIAVHGNLVSHHSADKSMEVILASIREKRDEQIKNGQTKKPKEKPMSTDEIFDIPDSWAWVALGDLCLLISRGKSPQYSDVPKYPVFAQKCNQPHQLALEKALFLDEDTLPKWPEYFRLQDGDIVINSTGNGTMGRVGYFETAALSKKYPFMVPDSHISLLRVGEGIIPKYIYYALRSPSIQKLMFKQFRGSTNQREYYIDSVYATPVPIPCTSEQEAIADKLDQIYRVLDIIDAAQQQYSADAESLKAKLITLGIQGKLTEQLPEDGTAEELYQHIQAEKQRLIKEGKIKKEKPLPEIKPEEVPFEIPRNWKWVRLRSVLLKYCTGPFGSMLHKSDYAESGVPLINPADIANGKVSFDKIKRVAPSKVPEMTSYILSKGDVVIGRRGEMGRAAVITKNEDGYICGTGCFFATPSGYFEPEYFVTMLKSDFIRQSLQSQSVGSTMDNLNHTILGNLLIPFPPLAEQRRILETIDRLSLILK